MRRRQPQRPAEVPPERLRSFHAPDWWAEGEARSDAVAFRRWQAARRAWADEHGLTMREFWRLCPRSVVVDRPAWVRGGGDDAA